MPTFMIQHHFDEAGAGKKRIQNHITWLIISQGVMTTLNLILSYMGVPTI